MRPTAAAATALGAVAAGTIWLQCTKPAPRPGEEGFRPALSAAAGWGGERCTSLVEWAQPGHCQVTEVQVSSQVMAKLAAAVDNASDSPDASVQRDQALFFAFDETLDLAVESLQQACDSDRSAANLTELAATHLLLWQHHGGSSDLQAALVLAAEAQNLPNRSSATTAVLVWVGAELGLRHELKLMWEELTRVPGGSEVARTSLERLSRPTWAEEWSKARQELERAMVSGASLAAMDIAQRYPLETRRWVVATKIPQWLKAVSGSDEERSQFDDLRVLARDRAERTGDDALLATIEAIDRSDPSRRRSLLRGLMALQDGVDGLSAGTQEGFERGVKQLHVAVSEIPTEIPSLLAEAQLELQIGQMQQRCGQVSAGLCYQQVRRELLRLCAETPQSWRAFHLRAHRVLGLIDVRDAKYGSALTHYRRALAFSSGLGEAESLAALRGQRAEALQKLGRMDEAWRELALALPAMERSGIAYRRHATLYWTTDYLRVAGHLQAALLFASEYTSAARVDGDPVSMVEAEMLLARCLLEDGRVEAASQALRRARAVRGANLVEEPEGRLATKLALAEVTVASRSADPRRLRHALDKIGRLSRLLEKLNERFDLRQLLADRARIFLHFGTDAGPAVEDQLAELIRQWFDLLSDADRLRLLGRDRELIRLMAQRHWRAGRTKDAWAEIERGRSAALLMRRSATDTLSTLLDPAAVQAALAPGELLVQFAVWPERTLVWAIHRNGWRTNSVVIRPAELARRVDGLCQAIRSEKTEDVQEQGAALHDLLFGDLLTNLSPQRRLMLSPDGPLHRLPWAALWNTRQQELPVQAAEISILPSAHFLLQGEPVAPTFDSSTSVLFVTNPKLSAEVAQSFPDLQGSAPLHKKIRKLFPKTARRIGGEANRNVLKQAQNYRILHFDLHGLYSPNPATSSLVLAPLDETDGVDYLLAEQIATLDLTGVDLVVLAGCDTARGFERGAGELDGLVRAFLAAGARGVIASQWKIEDRATSRFLENFYETLKLGASVSRALSSTQADLLTQQGTAVMDGLAFIFVGSG